MAATAHGVCLLKLCAAGCTALSDLERRLSDVTNVASAATKPRQPARAASCRPEARPLCCSWRVARGG